MVTGKKFLLRVITVLLAVCICISAVACKNNEEENKVNACNISVVTEGGMALPNISVYVYADQTKQELVWFGSTDQAGTVKFEGAPQEGYVIALGDVPRGYTVNETYAVTGGETKVTLSTYIDSDVDIKSHSFKKGDIMVDFSVTAVDGTVYKLSDILKEKKPVVLNFWYTNCEPCKAEFPSLQEAYAEYANDIVLLALNPVDGTPTALSDFVNQFGLTMPVAGCDSAWESIMYISAYPTTVVIDQYGMVSFTHTGSIPEAETFKKIFAYYAAEDYKQKVISDIDEILNADSTEEAGNLEFGGVTEFEVEVEAGKTVYCDVYKVSGMRLELQSATASITYNDVTYQPENGTISFMVSSPNTFTPVVLGITNNGSQKETYQVKFNYLKGTSGDPYTMELGEFTADVAAGNEQGVYYVYTAIESGTITVDCLEATANVNYEYVLYNLNTYEYFNLSNDGVDGAVSCYMNAGDQVQFSIATLPDAENVYPAGTFKMKATFAAGVGEAPNADPENTPITYTAKVTDDANKPMKNVSVTFIVEDSNMILTTDENGLVTMDLVPGTYEVKVTLPNGYTAEKSSYSVSPTATSVTIKLKKTVVVNATYTVKVVDSNNKALSNVLVSVGTASGKTNSSGVVTFTLPKSTYSAVIQVPSGYTSDKISFPFANGSTSLTITLKKGSSSDTTSTKKYSVTVVDAATGKAQTGVTVQFLKKGTAVSMAEVNSSGVATANLAAGDYTVSLSFSNGTYYYDKSAVTLTSSKTSTKVAVTTNKVSGNPEALYVGDAYPLTTGVTYVELPTSDVTYFMFTPTQQGVYKFETTSAAAVLSYWGSNTNFIFDLTSSTDYANNVFTLNIKETNLGANYIIGITGNTGTIVKITKTSDAQLDVEDLPWDVYEATHKPKPYTLPAGTVLKEFDLTATTASVKLVYNATDGFYHLNSSNGPLVYVNFTGSKYIQLASMLAWNTSAGGAPLRKIFYDKNGNFVKKEDYTDCVNAYRNCIDPNKGVYPLTKDLAYALQQHGEYTGWWNKTSPNYLFGSVSKLNPEIAWLFMCCYAG